MGKFIYFFGTNPHSKQNLTAGQADMKNLLGGKGANLAEMAKLNFPVPQGFTITTEVCSHYYSNGKNFPTDLKREVEENLKILETCRAPLKFGDENAPLLVSVRSGARASMPGMMDTVLNLGLNDKTVEGLSKLTGDARFAYDSYRRFISMYSDVVLNVHASRFENILEDMKLEKNVKKDTDLSADDLKTLCRAFKLCVLEEIGKKFPQDPNEQLWGAIGAVFESWMTPRAIHYRKMEQIPEDWGTAVNVQAMVFGNKNDKSATGVCFSRDPSSGENRFFGEFLPKAQGEDVVAGIRTPHPLTLDQRKRDQIGTDFLSLQELMPKVFSELETYKNKLEAHYKNMQDIEFTIEDGTLFLLQTRNGKRTTQAAVKIAIDMVQEKLITQDEALLRIDPYGIDQLLHPRLDPKFKGRVIAKGLPASPGAVTGKVVFNSNEAERQKAKNEKIILVRHETSPEDIHGMDASVGILTALGGMTSHAAVVARGMGKSCIVGCAEIQIDYKNKKFSCQKDGHKHEVNEGDVITLDANTGEIYIGEVPTISTALSADFLKLMEWADSRRRLKVRANADTPHDARVARGFGAEGIGLCRTEHMFFEPDRIEAVRAMILSDTADERAKALETILPMQRADFVGIFREMKGLPVTIRLLDPPLHEFLPNNDTDLTSLALKLKSSPERLLAKAHGLREANPMLGHRGCRLGISFPEIYEMQARAIAEAICEAARLTQQVVLAEIMIPLIFDRKEFVWLRDRIEKVVQKVFLEAPKGLVGDKPYQIGTMIEIPRAALMAKDIAQVAEFFSFGTNDLTQMTLGLSRDDCGKFLPEYIDNGILKVDPFSSIDVDGVGELVQTGVARGRQSNAQLKTGVCGEHGGDPRSIEFFNSAGLDYVSCSPYRVSAARLAAAQATLRSKKG
jgi:pyruvate,orthophosphate dikinase